MRVNLFDKVTIIHPPLNYYTVIFRHEDHVEQKTFGSLEDLVTFENGLDTAVFNNNIED